MLLYGSGGHAKVILDCLQANAIPVFGVFDDFSADKELLGNPLLGSYQPDLQQHMPIIMAIGENSIREKLSTQVVHTFGQVSHPSALVAENVTIGEGTVIFHNAVVQSSTLIGNHAVVNTSASVDHDCQVGDFAHVSPNATLCGGVSIGVGTHIGAGATIIPGIKVGSWAVVGAGAVVLEDVPDQAVVVGNPGKIIKFRA